MRTTSLLIASLLLVACPPTNDDDDPCAVEGALDEDLDDDGEPDCSDDTPTGNAPTVEAVNICELPVAPAEMNCPEPEYFVAEFRVSVADEDCDLNNPALYLTSDSTSPADARFEGDVGCGGVLQFRLCNSWVRGADFTYELWVQDALGNDSEVWADTWLVPAVEGDDDCTPL